MVASMHTQITTYHYFSVRGLPLPRRKADTISGGSTSAMEQKVFEAFFTLTINFITAGPLTMEKFSPQKQSLINSEYSFFPLDLSSS